MEKHELLPLQEKHKTHRISLLMRILSDEERHDALASACDEILDNRTHTTITTGAATRGEPTSIYTSTQLYHNSFLLKTIRHLRFGQPTTESE